MHENIFDCWDLEIFIFVVVQMSTQFNLKVFSSLRNRVLGNFIIYVLNFPCQPLLLLVSRQVSIIHDELAGGNHGYCDIFDFWFGEMINQLLDGEWIWDGNGLAHSDWVIFFRFYLVYLCWLGE